MSKAKGKLTKSERTSRKEKIISFIVLFLVSVLFAFPLIYMIGTSLKTIWICSCIPKKSFRLTESGLLNIILRL